MKKYILASLLLLLMTASASAQAAHSAAISWILSTSTGVTSQNVYRAPCAGTVTAGTCSTDSTATFTKLVAGMALGPTIKTFTDSTVAASTSYIYYVTAVCATCSPQESIPSGHLALTVPGDQPAPPTGLAITSVALNVTGSTQTILAKWQDTSGTQQSYFFTDGIKVLAQGLTSSATGSFAEITSSAAGVPIQFVVCNAVGQCITQRAM